MTLTRRYLLLLALVVVAIVLAPDRWPPIRSASAWAEYGIPTVNACGSGTTIAGTNSDFRITVGSEFGSASCIVNLNNHSSWRTLTDSPICTFSRGSSNVPTDLHVTTTSSTLSLTRDSGTWAGTANAVVNVSCAHNSNH